ncbi:class I SAM-dependent methyltransferase [Lentzea sp. NBRC 102530]|uniref:class I SAM-dependent methyltransferase n=1 Tax=Lentzea sp. NBRC 102530 TaxID=3032201 RepID=UPI0024A43630|nr:class I SAM-dependent methyltransferase [Lentzea sp. NBRC 102530]GLY47618.1 ubiquinone/menaquinone biosynthesis methyltransferase [Lentzea sp. NBRC 102530]
MNKLEVPGKFDRAARGYDLLVGLNPGYHQALRRSAGALGLRPGMRVLDLGCGTGASTAALLTAAPGVEVVAVDASAGMIARARQKRWPDRVRFVHSRAEDVDEGEFDAVFAAYLVRNLPEPDTTLTRVREMLKPGGTLVLHEYSVRDSPISTAVWTALCGFVVPMGWLVTGDRSLYTYLWRSVMDFDGATDLRNRLRRNGFTAVRSAPVPGMQLGVVHTFRGQAPEARS